ncbi:MAG: mannitol dehydrogenase family protein [Acidobacteria bacterium]|nr:mannitol dehydrogenase family protein [Acidobacteriota bacterium]
MSGPRARALTRSAYGASPRPPARIAHFGLGSFHRAHQLWFTAHAGDGDEWGICAFAGRASGLVAALRAQDGLYTLIERSASRDRFEVMTNLVEVHEGTESAAIVDVLSRREVVVVTTTVTESGYRMDLDGTPRVDDVELSRDVEALRGVVRAGELDGVVVATVPGRLLLGLEARRRADAGPLAVVPCDNVPHNGAVLRHALSELSRRISPELAHFLEENVSFVSTSVDRITPRTTDRDVALVARETPWLDVVPVVTEPFANWVLSGDFPGGRPRWEDAGALFVDDVEPYERRKLWLLNGAHSLLAYLGLEAGHASVAQAITDPRLRAAVESFWTSARHHLREDLDSEVYCAQLIERFENTRIDYQLEQIASDSLMKLRTRIAPVIIAERIAGRDCPAGVQAIAAWARRIMARGSFADAELASVAAVLERSATPVADLVRLVDPELDPRGDLAGRIERLVAEPEDGGLLGAQV